MTQLFAGLDRQGQVRFIGEVPRGNACGCFCPVCASPLVAKHGEFNDWHFAHEAAQERVECAVGAANMIRRITAEWMATRPAPVLPIYERRVRGDAGTSAAFRLVSWPAQIQPASLCWETSGLQSRPFLSGTLTTGVPFDAMVVVGDRRLLTPPGDFMRAHLVLLVPTPAPGDLIKRENLIRHIATTCEWIWLFHPDHAGKVLQARQEAQREAQRARGAVHSRLRTMHTTLNERLQQGEALRQQQRTVFEEQARIRQKVAESPDNSVPWAPMRKPLTSFVVYQLKDNQGTWVIYQRHDNTSWMIPLPKFDGWEESIPATVWTMVDVEVGFRLENTTAATIFLAKHAMAVRSSSDPAEIERIAGVS